MLRSRSETAAAGDGHLAVRPGTDGLILAWLLREVLAAPPDPARLAATTDADDMRRLGEAVRPLTCAITAQRCDVTQAELQALLAEVRAAGRIAIVTGSGSTFSEQAVLNELLRWALLAATGSLDVAGGMWFDTGYVSKLEERTAWAAAPAEGRREPGPASRPDLPGLFGELPCAAISDEIEAGKLKALIIGGGSPLTAFPDPERLLSALKKLEVLAVLDVVEAPLATHATHVLPVLRQLERPDIVFWNGRINFAPAALEPSGDRGATWRIYGLMAEALGLEVTNGLDPRAASDEEMLATIAANARYDLQTVLAAGSEGLGMPERTDRVLDAAVPGRRWRIAPPVLFERLQTLLKPEQAPAELLLNPRRQQQHTSSTHYVQGAKRRDRPSLLMSPADAARLGFTHGEGASVVSDAGRVSAVVEISPAIRPGAVSLPHGWIDANAAKLISADRRIDPLTGQPQMSAVPIRLERAEPA